VCEPTRVDDALVERQAALQAEARGLAAELRLEERLAPLGRVIPVGSAVTGLMVWRDLDYTVDAPAAAPSAVWAALQPLLETCESVLYRNETGEPPSDARHYFVFRIRGWKLDISIWTKGAPEAVERYQHELPARLDEQTRLVILRLKDAWHTRPDYPEVVGGYEIVEAVVTHGVRTVEQLERHLGAATPTRSSPAVST
jgi:hypothetical protein